MKIKHLFIYDSMKKNFYMHGTIAQTCKFVSKGRIISHEMFSVGGAYPIIKKNYKAGYVYGEIYSMYNSSVLDILDMMKTPDKRGVCLAEVKPKTIFGKSKHIECWYHYREDFNPDDPTFFRKIKNGIWRK